MAGRFGPLGVTRAEELHPLNAVPRGRPAGGYPFTDDVNGFLLQQEGFCRFDMNIDNGMRSSSASAFVEKGGRNPNLEVRTGVTATRIVVERGRAAGIELKTSNGKDIVRAEREVIVSGGAVGSPQLLLLGIGPADELKSIGIAPVHDLPGVGRNLHDHLEIDLQWECKEPITYNRLLRLDRMALIGTVGVLLFRSGFASKNQAHVGSFICSGPEVPHPNIQFHFFPVCF
ncbi:MAG: GMC family oxidoreductase N-terminal domain-containing protein [Hyphomicrobiaceae bacterium]